MNSKKSSRSLKMLIFVAILLIILGIVISSLNLCQVNDKVAKLTEDEEVTENSIIQSEEILAMYEVHREVASEEVVSRYNRAREREKYISIEEVTIAKDMDLTQRTNLSREDFITLIAGVSADTSGFFEENAGIIYDLCEEYGLNEIFFCGLISAESGWDIAGNHRRTHNYISLMGNGGSLIQFSSVEEGLRKAANTLHTNYLSSNGRYYCGKTLEGVRTRFCPVNPGWTNLVFGRMQQIVK